MTVLVIIFLLLALIMLIPLGVCASYDSGGLMLKVRVSAYKKQIFPREREPEPEPEPVLISLLFESRLPVKMP